MKLYLLAIALLAAAGSHAQVAINTDGSTADANAILDLKSFTRGCSFHEAQFLLSIV
jgi:hypothetical protein